MWRDELVDLVWGGTCLGCARPGRRLCPRCRRVLLAPGGEVQRRLWAGDDAAQPVPCVAGAGYEAVTAAVVPAWKETAAPGLLRALGHLHDRALQVLESGFGMDETGVWLVPVPSRPASLARRGFSPPLVLARRAAARRGAGGIRRRVAVGALRPAAGVRDQVGLSAAGRRANLTRGFRLGDPDVLDVLRRGRVVLVDDVVTTGATLTAAATVLARGGLRVQGAAVVADTPPDRRVAAGPAPAT